MTSMLTIKRTDGKDTDLLRLVMRLDKFLWSVYNTGMEKVILETGDRLTEAINLYRKHQYEITENYGPYIGIKESICMKKIIE